MKDTIKTDLTEAEFNALEKDTLSLIEDYQTVSARLNHNWANLVKQGMKIAKARGIELVTTPNLNQTPEKGQLLIYDLGSGEVDATNLLKLARDKTPELYTVYLKEKERYSQLQTQIDSAYRQVVFRMHI